jgi:hypothetical protein
LVCDKSFKNDKKRYFHLVEAHCYPKEFFFPQGPPKKAGARKTKPKQKKILCRYIKQGQICPFDENCHFVHNKSELVPTSISFGRHHSNQKLPSEEKCDVMDMSD